MGYYKINEQVTKVATKQEENDRSSLTVYTDI